MSVESYDWSFLDDKINKKASSKLMYDEVKHLFRKVAFDVYKPLNGSDKLWELRDDEDGTQYLVALYDDDGEDIVINSEDQHDWTAVADHEGNNVTLSFRKFPITRIAMADHNVDSSKADEFARFLEKKAQDESFVSQLLSSLPRQKRLAVQKLLGEKDS